MKMRNRTSLHPQGGVFAKKYPLLSVSRDKCRPRAAPDMFCFEVDNGKFNIAKFVGFSILDQFPPNSFRTQRG